VSAVISDLSKGEHVPHPSSGFILYISTTVPKTYTRISNQLPHSTTSYSLITPLAFSFTGEVSQRRLRVWHRQTLFWHTQQFYFDDRVTPHISHGNQAISTSNDTHDPGMAKTLPPVIRFTF
jgi:hypothetical protein